MSAGTDGALDALRALAKQGRAADPAAIVAAVAALELSTAVFESLLDEFSAAVQRGPAMGWQRALGAFIGRLSEEQLSSWRWEAADVRWSAAEGATSSPTASLEVVPWLLHRSCWRINEGLVGTVQGGLPAQHMGTVLPLIAALTRDSLAFRNTLLRPLVQHAVRHGAACLPLADACALGSDERTLWGTAGTWWAEQWAPERAAHAAFHPRFRAAVRTLLLASHRGLPGAALDADPISLPSDVLLAIVRCMALAPGMQAAWVPLAHVPASLNLNSCCCE